MDDLTSLPLEDVVRRVRTQLSGDDYRTAPDFGLPVYGWANMPLRDRLGWRVITKALHALDEAGELHAVLGNPMVLPDPEIGSTRLVKRPRYRLTALGVHRRDAV